MPTQSDAEEHLKQAITAALLADGTLPAGSFTVVVSHRRRAAAVSTRPDGHRLVRVLPSTSPEHAVRFIRANRRRLEEHAQRLRDLSPDRPIRSLTSGETYHWLGRPVTLQLTPGAEAAEPGNLMLVDAADVDQRGAQAVIDWYRRRGVEWMEGAGPGLWHLVGAPERLPELAVRDLGRRREGLYDGIRRRVTLHWRVFQLDAPLVEYALCHELTHGTRPPGTSHGPEFWRRLCGALPDALERHRTLRQTARFSWSGDVED